jgi:uncharacterized protein (DUF58 family)
VSGRARSGLRPTRWSALALGAVALGTVLFRLPVGLVVGLCAIGAGLVGTDLLLAFRAKVTMERSTLPVLARQVAHPITVGTGVDGGRLTRLRQPAPPELGIEPAETGQVDLVGTVTGRHRGIHQLPPAVVRVAGPLGLASCDHTVGPSDAVTVLPDLPRARRLAALRRQGRTTEEGKVRSRLGLGTEFESIREYSVDDDIRQVNWLATARIGRPMTNQYRIDDNRDLLCLVDCGRLMASPVEGSTRLDVALDALAVLAVAADEAGDRVGTVAFAGDILRQLEPRRRGAEGVVRALFDLEPTEVESDYDRAFQSVAGRKRSLVALFTDLVDAAAARTLLEVMPILIKRHVIMVVSGRDVDLQRALSDTPHDIHDVLRATVALDLLSARRRTFTLLKGLGVVVVEADPLSLGPACVTAYGSIKSAGRL